MRKVLYVTSLAISFGLGGVVTYFAHTFTETTPRSTPTDYSEKSSDYHYINPLLFCEDQALSQFDNSISNDINAEVKAYIQKEKDSGELIDASVYFRDLKEGPWTLVNGPLLSAPASLLKIPLAISVYSAAEKDRSLLQRKIKFTGDEPYNFTQYFKPAEQIVAGNEYTVEDLVHYMVQDSDNAALYLLSNVLSESDLANSYTRLGIPEPTTATANYQMNVHTVASFFRVLYNASYLNQEDSEHLLSLLAASKFDSGIGGGVPRNVPVANKFGESTFPNGNLQLGDCGIVYRPNTPYLLCILTHGKDYDIMAKAIATISKTVWNIVDQADNKN